MDHIRDLQDLIHDRGREAVERELRVHRTTVTRWLDGTVKMPAAARAHVAMLLGHLPGTEGNWRGWRFWKGELWSPEGYRFTAGDLHAQRYERATIEVLRRELIQVQATLADLVRERAERDVAANDAAEVRVPVRSR